MKNKNFLFGLILFSCMVFFSCKGKEGEPGPVGPAGPAGPAGEAGAGYNPAQNYVFKEGFVKGTATGTLLNSNSYNYAFDFQGNYSGADNKYEIISSTQTKIKVYKASSGDGVAFDYAEFSMTFDVASLADLSTPTPTYMSIKFTKDLGNSTFHYANYEYNPPYSVGVAATVSGLVYNSTTGVLTGNYTFNATADASRGSLNIADGTFSTKLSTIVMKKAAQ